MMKVAIAAMSSEFNAQIAEHAARAPYYFVHDSEKDTFEVFANPVSQVERAAGPQAAEFLISIGASQVVAGRFGPKFRSELEGSGIICLERTGAVSSYLNG
jgi:predicted Fe-Mo cluster-binding NifX family protein